MKTGLCAQILIYDDMQYVHFMLENVLKYCDEVLFLVNKHPLNYNVNNKYDNSETVNKLKELQKDNAKISIIWEDWRTEEETRNYGLNWALHQNCEYSLIVDTDEVYDDASLRRLKDLLEVAEASLSGNWIYHTNWKTYWKKYNGPLCVINPPESFQPVVVVRNRNAKFVHLRHCMPFDRGQQLQQNHGRALLPEGFLNLHHFSYARSDEFISRKCKESGHSANGDLMQGWFENVWMKWKLGDKNLHPINPEQYKEAILVKKENLPNKELQVYFFGENV